MVRLVVALDFRNAIGGSPELNPARAMNFVDLRGGSL